MQITPDGVPDPSYPRWGRLARVALGAAVIATAVGVFCWQHRVRDGEMDLAGTWFGTVLSGGVQSSGDAIYFSWTGGPLIGLRDTWECTVALLAGPILAIGGMLLALTRLPVPRLLTGLVAALGVVVAVNQLRLLMIAFSLQNWGMTGYDVSHQFVGSLFAIAGFAVAALIFLRVAGASRHRHTGHAAT